MALGQAGVAAKGATVYVTLEPCAHESARGPACADLLAAARPAHVVIGAGDPDPRTDGKGAERLRAAGISVIEGTRADEAEAMMARSEEHTSELQSLMRISYAVFCLKKKKKTNKKQHKHTNTIH